MNGYPPVPGIVAPPTLVAIAPDRLLTGARSSSQFGTSIIWRSLPWSIIDFHISTFTALSVDLLDDVHPRTTYSEISLYPCEI